MTHERPSDPKRSKAGRHVTGGLLLVLLLAGAAFLAGRLMNRGPASLFFFNPGGGERPVTIEFVRSPDLPARAPDASGILSRRDGNSLFIAMRGRDVAFVDGGSNLQADEAGGPVIEVVVTHDTVILKDVTELPSDFSGPSAVVPQQVAPGSLEEIGEGYLVDVWGRTTGERIVAGVIYCFDPFAFESHGP